MVIRAVLATSGVGVAPTAFRGKFRGRPAADVGYQTLQIVNVADDHPIVVRVRSVAAPGATVSEPDGDAWRREHGVPLLASPTERRIDEAIRWFAVCDRGLRLDEDHQGLG
jgi:hypothetical protein